MTWDKVLKAINIIFPLIGMGLMIFYDACDTSCSYLQGTLLGIDLKIVGILFMAGLLAAALPPFSRYPIPIDHLRTMMLSAAIGGEILLVRFQIAEGTYCPFCLAFGMCLLVLFAANFIMMNKYLALGSFLAGIGAFVLFFEGSVLPLYG
ncbi:hypothetical protein [Syntrophus aciditrophicus]|uniref:Hypothetical membrane protein n=1 Tax=Syntrophus aciditrophicus (strain SB) TaxID=56780 RepID=Q2LXL2_SYNAS|nr:hypothetical protein [Syntrophus aciditrophicus]ABC78822.1 hypothetical membrane protein [Syntrophus aciditrophicus SB]